MKAKIAVLPGDGIGPEVVAEGLRVEVDRALGALGGLAVVRRGRGLAESDHALMLEAHERVDACRARTVRDAAIMLQAMCGHDPKDSTSAKLDVPDFEKALTRGVKGLKIGIPKEYRPDGLNAEVSAMWDKGMQWLKDAGATPVDISLPHTKYALPAYYIVAPAEASSNLARYDGVRYGLRDLPEGAGLQDMYAATRAAGFGAEV